MGQVFSNGARALLQGSITATTTSLTVEAGKADFFPVGNTVNWATPLNWFKAVLINSAGQFEVIKVGSRTLGSGVLNNILRGQEGTTPLAFAANSAVIAPFTAGDMQAALAGVFAALTSESSLTVAGKITQKGVEGRVVPVGGCIPYTGSVAAIPAGWALMDGTGGRPDWGGKFFLGYKAGSYAMGAVGGSKDAILLNHNHGLTISGNTGVESHDHTHGVIDPGHAHGALFQVAVGGGYPGFDGSGDAYTNGNTSLNGTGISLGGISQTHYHAYSWVGFTNQAGNSVDYLDKNMPPYVVGAWIICLAEPA